MLNGRALVWISVGGLKAEGLFEMIRVISVFFFIQWMDGGHCIPALQLAIQLCRSYLIEEKHRSIVTEAEFSNTLETLARVYQNRQNPEGYVKNKYYLLKYGKWKILGNQTNCLNWVLVTI